MKPLMKTWKIVVNVILGAFGILSIVTSVFGLKTLNEHPESYNQPLYAFIIFMIVLGSLCCIGVIIWVTTDLLITLKNPNNAYDEKGHYSKYKIKKYKNNFSPGKLPTLNKNKLNDTEGYFAQDLKYTDEYLKQQAKYKNNNKNIVNEIALKVEQRKEKNKKSNQSNKKHKK